MKFGKGPRKTIESDLPSNAYPAAPSDVTRLEKNFGLAKAANRLPIATEKTVNTEMWTLLWSHKKGFFLVAGLQLFTTMASLIPPRVFGNLLDRLTTSPEDIAIGRTVAIVIAALVIQTTLVYFTRVRASVLGEFVLSSLRERFVERVVQLPP